MLKQITPLTNEAINDSSESRLPVYVLTGFLGSGKTTALRKFLTEPESEGTAIVVNEFAEINIDQTLIEHRDEDLISLTNGCVCCAARDKLVDALHYLGTRQEVGKCRSFRRVVIETTGLADPNPVVHALLSDTRLKRHFCYASVLTVVDSTHALDQLERFLEAKQQVAAADYVLLSKTDLCDPETISAVTSLVQSLNPTAIHQTVRNGFIFSNEISEAQISLGQLRSKPLSFRSYVSTLHDSRVTSLTIIIPERLRWHPFCDWLQGVCLVKGRNLLRFKGIVFTKTDPRPIAIHAVHFTIYPPESIDDAGFPDEKSRLIFIGFDLKEDLLRRTLAAANR